MLSEIPSGLTCTPWKWKFVVLKWCGKHHIDRHRIGVGRQIVDEADAQDVAGPHAERRARDGSFVGSQVQAIAADLLVGIADVQGRSQFSVHRAADFRLNQRRAFLVGSSRNADSGPARGPACRPDSPGPVLWLMASPTRPGDSSPAASPVPPVHRTSRRDSPRKRREVGPIGFMLGPPLNRVRLRTCRWETARNEVDKSGLEESRHDGRTTPGEDDPWKRPIGPRLGRVDIDPERVGDRQRRNSGNEQQPPHSLRGRTDESAGRADDHQKIDNQQGQGSERGAPEKGVRSRSMKHDADGCVSHDRREDDADRGIAGRAAYFGNPPDWARRSKIPAQCKEDA